MARALIYLNATSSYGIYRSDEASMLKGFGSDPDPLFTYTDSCSFDPSSDRVAVFKRYVSAPAPAELHIYETRGYTRVTQVTIASNTGNHRAIQFSPDGTKLAVFYRTSPYLQVFETTTWTAIAAPDFPPETVETLSGCTISWSANSRYLALVYSVVGGGSNTKLWVGDYNTGSPVRVTTKTSVASHFGTGVAWSPDGARLLVGLHESTTNIISIYETTGWTAVSNPTGYPSNGCPTSIAWQGNYVVVGGNTPLNFLYAYDTGGSNDATTWTLTSHTLPNPLGLATLSRGDTDVRMAYYSHTDKIIRTAFPPTQAIGSHFAHSAYFGTASSIDIREYATQGATPTPKIIMYAEGSTAPYLRFVSETGTPRSITLGTSIPVGGCHFAAFSDDGTLMAASVYNASDEAEVWLYDFAPPYNRLAILYTAPDTTTYVNQLKFSPDGTKLCVTLSTGFKIYNTSTYASYSPENVSFIGSNTENDPGRISWSPNSRYVALMSWMDVDNRDIRRVYDTNTTTPTLVSAASEDGTASTSYGGGGAYSPDGTRFLSGILSAGTSLKYYNTTGWTTVTLPTPVPPTGQNYDVIWVGDYVFIHYMDDTRYWVYDTGGSNDATTWTLFYAENLGNYLHPVVSGTPASYLFGHSDKSRLYTPLEIHNLFSTKVSPPENVVFSASMLEYSPPPGVSYDEDVAETTEITAVVTDAAYPGRVATQGFTVTAPLVGDVIAMLYAGVEISEAVLQDVDVLTAEIIQVSATVLHTALHHLDVAALVRLAETVQAGFTVLLTESVELGDVDDALVDRYVELGERVLLDGAVNSMLQAQAILAQAFAVASMAATYEDADASDEVVVEVAATALHEANNLIESLFQVMGVVSLTNSVFVAVPEAFQVSALPDSQAELNELLTEVFRVGALVDVSGEVFTVLATNMTSSATTRYTNYAFNSIARIGVDYVGAADDGLYLLEGETDDGDPIYAGIKTGLMDFGIPELKRVMNAYVGLTRAGRLLMKVVTANRKDEAPTERWYALKQNARGGDVVGSRFELGRGIKSRYWQFEAVNVDGDDFEWDVLDLDLIRLSRRS